MFYSMCTQIDRQKKKKDRCIQLELDLDKKKGYSQTDKQTGRQHIDRYKDRLIDKHIKLEKQTKMGYTEIKKAEDQIHTQQTDKQTA